MNRKIVLHIGAAKTGSSAIQSFMARNKDFFQHNGFVIPGKSLDLDSAVSGEHVFAFQGFIARKDKEGLRKTLERLDAATPKGKTLFFSAENLSNLGNHEIFRDNLEGFDVQVIVYIRRQDDLICSAWQQWHSKIESDINAWLIKALVSYGHWDRVIQNWESVVGEGRVSVRVFQREDMVEGDLLRDFLAALGLDPKIEDLDFGTGPINPSYNDVITSLVTNNSSIFANVHDNEFYNFVSRVTGDEYTKMRKVSLITKEQRNNIIQFYVGANHRVCSQYFPGRPALFEKVKHSDYDYLSPAEMTERQMQFLTTLIYKLGQQHS